jgi:hypothetical protein
VNTCFFRFLNEFCTLDPLESSETCDFIDLLKNEEKFTGYAGPTANRISSKIYSELCFLPEEVPLPAVLRFRDVYPLSQIPDPDFTNPGSKNRKKKIWANFQNII